MWIGIVRHATARSAWELTVDVKDEAKVYLIIDIDSIPELFRSLGKAAGLRTFVRTNDVKA